MSKTLALILNYNTPDLTHRLYEQLKPWEGDQYTLEVLDNGSPMSGQLPYAKYRLEKNTFYGGGINTGFKIFASEGEWDSLLFLNSDLILHGYNFVRELRKAMFEEGFKLVSPTIIQPEKSQCFWPTMHCWNSKEVRRVPWIDFQAPLLHKDLINQIGQFDDDLLFGWGNDVYSGLVCESMGWKVGVVDYCPVIHLSAHTVKRNSDDEVIKNYSRYAEQGMHKFFSKTGRLDDLYRLRNLAINYKFS